MANRNRLRYQFAGVLLLALVCAFIAYPKLARIVPPVEQWLATTFTVNLGLDLQGGIHLEYKADTTQVESGKENDALQAAVAVIERRVNAFGVAEPLVQLSRSGAEHRIIVELPGVKDIEEAKKMIKETPFLEFREYDETAVTAAVNEYNAAARPLAEGLLAQALRGDDFAALAREHSDDPGSKENGGEYDFQKRNTYVPEFDDVTFNPDFQNGSVWPELVETQFGWHLLKKIDERGEGDEREVRVAHVLVAKATPEMFPDLLWTPTGLTGKHIADAFVDYQSQGVGAPQVGLRLDSEGADLFADITKRNVGKPLGIFIDDELVSSPTVNQEIIGGQAVITGRFTLQEVKQYVQRLNEGALPLPITLVAQQSVDASLGAEALQQSLFAGMVGLAAVGIFMVVYYRFLGLIAVVTLLLYSALLLTLFKLSTFTPLSITVTLSGIAGFVLSIGMAVDANVLIFERTREELAFGKNVYKALDEGFRRAWPSIRDGNYSTLITTFILMAMGAGFVQGFALILTLGILLSMFTAIVLVRVMIRFLVGSWLEHRVALLVAPKRLLE